MEEGYRNRNYTTQTKPPQTFAGNRLGHGKLAERTKASNKSIVRTFLGLYYCLNRILPSIRVCPNIQSLDSLFTVNPDLRRPMHRSRGGRLESKMPARSLCEFRPKRHQLGVKTVDMGSKRPRDVWSATSTYGLLVVIFCLMRGRSLRGFFNALWLVHRAMYNLMKILSTLLAIFRLVFISRERQGKRS